jgi:hypothetical protein
LRDGVTAEQVDAVTSRLPPTVTAVADFELGLLVVEWGDDCSLVTMRTTSNILLDCGLFARRIRLYCDYAPWPLWWAPGLPDENNRSDVLKERIGRWHNSYLGDEQHPVGMWEPPHGAVDVEQAWVEEGEAIRALIQEELGPGYKVEFDT